MDEEEEKRTLRFHCNHQLTTDVGGGTSINKTGPVKGPRMKGWGPPPPPPAAAGEGHKLDIRFVNTLHYPITRT